MVLPVIHPRKRSAGFTLVELLAVIAIMILILGAAGAALMPSNRTMQLSSVSLQIKGYLDQGRQLALSRNRYVQVRFYHKTTDNDPKTNVPYYSAIGLFSADSPYYGTGTSDYDTYIQKNQMYQAAPVLFLDPSTGIPSPSDGKISSLLNDLGNDQYFTRKVQSDKLRGQPGQYDWVSFYYMPNGTTDFQTLSIGATGPGSYDPKSAFFSLIMRNEYQRDTTKIPSDFFTFYLPPSTGRAVILRP